MRMGTVLWMLALLLAAGCGGEDQPQGDGPRADPDPAPAGDTTLRPADWPAENERRLKPDHAPTPYTAEQIRQGCRDGRRSTFRFELGGRENFEHWAFDRGDAKGVTWTRTRLQPDKTPMSEPVSSVQAWADLQAHASYPAADTTVSEETLELPFGRFACMLYSVAGTREVERSTKDGPVKVEQTVLTKYWFAYALPGPPVRMERHIDGEHATTMALVENRYESGR